MGEIRKVTPRSVGFIMMAAPLIAMIDALEIAETAMRWARRGLLKIGERLTYWARGGAQ